MTHFIVPVFNVEKYLEKCLDSILNQTEKNFDIICVDDGSTDSSNLILKKYKDKNSKIIILEKENGGLSSARNAALNFLKTNSNDFIVFVDSDDYIDSKFLEYCLKEQEKYDADIVAIAYKSFTENDMPKIKSYNISVNVLDKAEALKKLLSDKIKCHIPCKLYKASLWEKNRFDENIKFLEDQYLTPQIFNICNKIVCSNYIGYYYLHRKTSLCGSKKSNKKIIDAIYAYIFLYSLKFDVSNKYDKKLKRIILDQFFDVYLMLVPRFDFTKASNEEKEKMKYAKLFLKTNKAYKYYKINSLKRLFKKIIYILLGDGFVKIYRCLIKN